MAVITGVWYWLWVVEVHVRVSRWGQWSVRGTNWSSGWQTGQYSGGWLGQLSHTGKLWWWHTVQFLAPVSGQSTDTRNWLACHTFLVPETDAGLNEHVQFRAGNRLESWTVIAQSEQTIAQLVCLWTKMKDEVKWWKQFLTYRTVQKKWISVSNSQSRNLSLFCLPVSFAGKVCRGFWHQTTGACFRRQKMFSVSSALDNLSSFGFSVFFLDPIWDWPVRSILWPVVTPIVKCLH